MDSVPYLDRMPFLAKAKETTGEEKWSGAPGASAEPGEIPACPGSEESKAGEAARETEGSGETPLLLLLLLLSRFSRVRLCATP